MTGDHTWTEEFRRRLERDSVITPRPPESGDGLELRPSGGAPATVWDNVSHEEMIAAISTNANPAAVAEAAEEWIGVGDELILHERALTAAIEDSTGDWRGAAGDTARHQLAEVGRWLDSTARGARLTGGQQRIHAEALEETRKRMAANPPVRFSAAEANAQLRQITDPVEYARKIEADRKTYEAQQVARAEAARIMTQFDRSLGETVATPVFAAPPKLPGTAAAREGGEVARLRSHDAPAAAGVHKGSDDRIGAAPDSHRVADVTSTAGFAPAAASLAGQPGVPGQAGVPGQLGQPGVPAQPSMPGQSGVPGVPSQPGVLGQAGVPGQPGVPGVSGQPGMLGQPGVPGVPGVSGQPGVPGQPTGPDQSRVPGQPGVPVQPGVVAQPGVPVLPGGPPGPPGAQPFTQAAHAADASVKPDSAASSAAAGRIPPMPPGEPVRPHGPGGIVQPTTGPSPGSGGAARGRVRRRGDSDERRSPVPQNEERGAPPPMGGPLGAGRRPVEDEEYGLADYLEADPELFEGEQAIAPPTIGDWKNKNWK
ncbi:PPE domain-containing protein [Amycolatopsis sp. YIM 10]|uniref:PPE domain-containing protein n=1 Tax=Amycolatopsis sp. YIM 10 TaxID=2653857 RepID=UPI0012A88961|nr:PPE domain-containing protein [Amycolatopsis sp. YIM 10]QFU91645.1 Collagen triple helix repeat (20 copies) [Amycolatopsis sp. YIM 10]